MPAPVRLTVCGLFAAESVNVSVPVMVPFTAGVNVTLTVQEPLAGIVPPETTTGGACVCAGGDAGAAGVAELCTGTSGGGVARGFAARTPTVLVFAE